MPTSEETIERIAKAATWDQRVAQIRLIPQHRGTSEHQHIFARIARLLYLPHLAPDFAYVHEARFYDYEFFLDAYRAAYASTNAFEDISEESLITLIRTNPKTLLVFRTILGLTKEEFAHSTTLAGEPVGLQPLSSSKVDSMERRGSTTRADQARVAAIAIRSIMDGFLFAHPPTGLKSKQTKPDTEQGWASVRHFATDGVPMPVYLHQRHFGGAFRQVLDATSTKRGDLIEEAVESLFKEHRIPFLRTGANNQAEIAARFEVRVAPAPDFVVFDKAGTLRALLECKGTNNGGTARDKALRFERLRDESIRLGGVPLIAVLGGMGWTRLNDALGPVVRDTDGRVFTLATLQSLVEVSPFPTLMNTAPHN